MDNQKLTTALSSVKNKYGMITKAFNLCADAKMNERSKIRGPLDTSERLLKDQLDFQERFLKLSIDIMTHSQIEKIYRKMNIER